MPDVPGDVAGERRLVEPQPAEAPRITGGMVGDSEGEPAPAGIDDREGRRIARPEQIARPNRSPEIRLDRRAGDMARHLSKSPGRGKAPCALYLRR